MQRLPDIFIILILSFIVYIPVAVVLYRQGTSAQERESPTIGGLLAFCAAFGTAVVSIGAFEILGTHKGYWLISFIITVWFGAWCAKHIWESMSGRFNPMMIGGYLPIFLLDGCIGVGILFFFWCLSLVLGIASNSSYPPFKF